MTGQLKRKRSDSELSFSSSTTFSSPPRLVADFGSPISIADRGTPVSAMFRGRSTPLHLNSRTLKRFRNSRPSDAEVHERTLNLLYTAQQSMRHQASPSPEQNWQEIDQRGQGEQDGQHDDQEDTSSSPGQHGLTLDSTGVNQRSLHSFWSLAQPASRQQSASVAAANGYTPAARTGLSLHASGEGMARDEEYSIMS